jgi:hypothetical protein
MWIRAACLFCSIFLSLGLSLLMLPWVPYSGGLKQHKFFLCSSWGWKGKDQDLAEFDF